MISYSRIAKAIDYYTKLGYQYIEVPWLVEREAANLAAPEGTRLFETFAGCLPASAEQSFYSMILDGQLPPGRYQAVTPCYRDEPLLNHWTQTHFLKLELIYVLPETPLRARPLIGLVLEDAYNFMTSQGVQISIKDGLDDLSRDLVSCPRNIELGSYGLRQAGGHSWIYGTGLAEPRFSRVLEDLNNGL